MIKPTPELIAKMANMPYEDLFRFWAFATIAHGPTAADALGLTPSGLGVSICRLQNKLGAKLFRNQSRSGTPSKGMDRVNGGPVNLSASGHALFDRLDPLFIRFPGAIRAGKTA